MLDGNGPDGNGPEGSGRSGGVRVEIEAGVAVVTIDRPEVRNAIGFATVAELDAALDARRCVGRGGARAAGWRRPRVRLGWRPQGAGRGPHARGRSCDGDSSPPRPRPGRRLPRPDDRRPQRSRAGRRRRGRHRGRHPHRGRRREDRLQPGRARDHAGVGRGRALAQKVGRSRALLAIATGEIYAAADAQRLGLIDVVVPRAALEDQWRGIAQRMAALAPGTTRAVKAVIARGGSVVPRRPRSGRGRGVRGAVGRRRALGRGRRAGTEATVRMTYGKAVLPFAGG